ncbi:hypothetical protein GYB22_01440 [bacterium]|nr:hypothetical protein [bacterium]
MKTLKWILLFLVAAIGTFSAYLLIDIFKDYFLGQQALSQPKEFPKVSLIPFGMAFLSFCSIMYNIRTFKYYKAFPHNSEPHWHSPEMDAIRQEKNTKVFNVLNIIFGIALITLAISILALLFTRPPSNTRTVNVIVTVISVTVTISTLVFIEFAVYFKKRKRYKKENYERLISEIDHS